MAVYLGDIFYYAVHYVLQALSLNKTHKSVLDVCMEL
jgi:hypothetical protein